MVGKTIQKVYDFLKKNYPDRLATIPDDLDTLSDEFKDGNWHYFFGSLRDQDGMVGVPNAYWDGGKWYRYAYWLDDSWDANDRIVLLEKNLLL